MCAFASYLQHLLITLRNMNPSKVYPISHFVCLATKLFEAAKAGVPEHFNAPFHLAKERGLYEAKGIDMQILGFKGWCWLLRFFGAGSI